MGRGAVLTMPLGMTSHPYPAARETVSMYTECEICDKSLLTRDWASHKNSKKHREKETALKAEEKKPTNGFDLVGFSNNANDATATDTNGWGNGDASFAQSNTNDSIRGGGGDRPCYGCGEMGHIKRDCPKGSSGQACYGCGEVGHRKSDCPNGRGYSGGGGGDRVCFNCNQPGHNKADCPEPRSGGGGGGGGRACHNCGVEGHISRECPEPKVMKCRNCDSLEHQARECDKPKDWSRVKCRNCNNFGHGEKRCPEPPQEQASGGSWGDAGNSGGAATGGWEGSGVGTAGGGVSGDWASDPVDQTASGDWAGDSNTAGGESSWGDAAAATSW